MATIVTSGAAAVQQPAIKLFIKASKPPKTLEWSAN